MAPTRLFATTSSCLPVLTPTTTPLKSTLNYGPYGGVTPFSQNIHTDYAYGRIDAEVTSKVRLFASWLAQDQKAAGESLPTSDSVQGYYNVVTGCSGTGASLNCTGNFIDSISLFAHLRLRSAEYDAERRRRYHPDQQSGIHHPARILL